jgi:hypothetical protein
LKIQQLVPSSWQLAGSVIGWKLVHGTALQPSADREVKSVTSKRQVAGFDPEKTRKKDFDSLLTVLSNCTSPFVCNKTSMPGGGLAEGHRQRAAKGIARIAKIVGIAKIENANPNPKLTTD